MVTAVVQPGDAHEGEVDVGDPPLPSGMIVYLYSVPESRGARGGGAPSVKPVRKPVSGFEPAVAVKERESTWTKLADIHAQPGDRVMLNVVAPNWMGLKSNVTEVFVCVCDAWKHFSAHMSVHV